MINRAKLVGEWCDITWDTDGELWVVCTTEPYPGLGEQMFGSDPGRIEALKDLRSNIRQTLRNRVNQ